MIKAVLPGASAEAERQGQRGKMDAIEANKNKTHEAFLKKEIYLESLPDCFDVYASTFCNLKCAHCLGHGPLSKRANFGSKRENFDMKLLDKIAEPLSVAEYLSFHGFSEPMLSEAYWRLVEFSARVCASPGRRRTHIITNGNYKINGGGRMDRLLGDSVTRVMFSVDAGSEEIYAKIRRGGDFSTLCATIEALLRERRTRGLEERISIQTTYALMRDNLADFIRHVELFTGMGVDAVEASGLRNYGNDAPEHDDFQDDGEPFDYKGNMLSDKDGLKAVVQSAALAAARNGKKLIYSDAFPRKERFSHCWWPYKFASVDVDGSVFPCCDVKRIPFGNLRNSGFREIWNNELYQSLRLELALNKGPAICKDSLCNHSGGGL